MLQCSRASISMKYGLGKPKKRHQSNEEPSFRLGNLFYVSHTRLLHDVVFTNEIDTNASIDTLTMHCVRDYWDGVPNIYKKRLHYYNTPITSDVSNAAHPLSIIRSIYRPGDFISLKLDIDNVPLELAIVDAIENDSELIEAIGEMFYEQHYDHAGRNSLARCFCEPCLTPSVFNFQFLRYCKKVGVLSKVEGLIIYFLTSVSNG